MRSSYSKKQHPFYDRNPVASNPTRNFNASRITAKATSLSHIYVKIIYYTSSRSLPLYIYAFPEPMSLVLQQRLHREVVPRRDEGASLQIHWDLATSRWLRVLLLLCSVAGGSQRLEGDRVSLLARTSVTSAISIVARIMVNNESLVPLLCHRFNYPPWYPSKAFSLLRASTVSTLGEPECIRSGDSLCCCELLSLWYALGPPCNR